MVVYTEHVDTYARRCLLAKMVIFKQSSKTKPNVWLENPELFIYPQTVDSTNEGYYTVRHEDTFVHREHIRTTEPTTGNVAVLGI